MTEHKGRIDIRVEGNKFNLSYVKAGGTVNNLQLSKADWLLSGDQEKHWFAEGVLCEKLSNICIEFISGGTGEVRLEFRGGWFNDLAVNRHAVWVADIDFKGGDMMEPELGETPLLVWHDEPAVQKILTTAGKRYRVSAWFKPDVV